MSVLGESGLGKSTLVNSLFLTDLYKDRKLLNAEGKTDTSPLYSMLKTMAQLWSDDTICAVCLQRESSRQCRSPSTQSVLRRRGSS